MGVEDEPGIGGAAPFPNAEQLVEFDPLRQPIGQRDSGKFRGDADDIVSRFEPPRQLNADRPQPGRIVTFHQNIHLSQSGK